MPSAEDFNYSFESFSNIVASFLDQLTIKRYALYVMDYGAPTGLRVAVAHPGCVTALIVQNGNAYEDGIGDFWEPTRAYWAEPEAMRDAMRPFLTLEGTRFQYLTGTTDPKRIDPAAWLTDQLFLDRPGSTDIQLDIIYDYRTNVALYPKFHRYFREHRPPVLILWGEKDPIFLPDGARAFLRDLPDAELHFFDTGHFALEEKADEMIPILHDFLTRTLAS